MKHSVSNEFGMPAVVDRGVFQSELDALRVREKAHTREGDAIAAARRRLPRSKWMLRHDLSARVGRR